jgi:hypothetical protein
MDAVLDHEVQHVAQRQRAPEDLGDLVVAEAEVREADEPEGEGEEDDRDETRRVSRRKA